LDFTVNEPISKATYNVDGQDNVTITGNTTLSCSSVGVHKVTVYAWDKAGNVGASETISFTNDEPFPFVPVATASLSSVAFVSASLLVYFKKRKHWRKCLFTFSNLLITDILTRVYAKVTLIKGGNAFTWLHKKVL
jgi:hypothetical protein